jgi:hypothetical protein
LATEAKKEFRSNGGIFWLWLGLLLPAIAWALQQSTLYVMVGWACQTGNFFAMHAVSLSAFVVAALGAFVSWRNWQGAGRERSDDDRAGALPRSRFMSVLGLTAGGFFALVIFAQWLAVVVIHPCMF